jgi:hypothetical protein
VEQSGAPEDGRKRRGEYFVENGKMKHIKTISIVPAEKGGLPFDIQFIIDVFIAIIAKLESDA